MMADDIHLKTSLSMKDKRIETAFLKKLLSIFIIFILISLVSYQTGLGQKTAKARPLKTTWVANGDPFQTDVFIENLGQFNNWATSPDPIKYAINKSEKIFFTKQGLTIRVDKIEKINESEREEKERKTGEEANRPLAEKYYVNMHWVGSNANARITVSEQSEGYYTFGEKGFENIKAKGYKKLVYTDLYPGIDVEYTISKKGGFKYSLIVHPGADLSKVKMQYSGDIDKMTLDIEGNILISTDAGIITDHAPQSYYQGSTNIIPSAFILSGKTIEFNLPNGFSNTSTLVIDPWTTVPATLTTDNSAFDVGYNDAGDTYVSGGVCPYKLAKYDANGNFIWTYTNPAGFGNDIYYSRFCTLPVSGTSFIGEAWNGSGPRVMKIDNAGNLILTSPNLANNQEIWVMFFNRCTGNMVGFGGGTQNPNNMQMIADTNLTSSYAMNFNSYSDADNDVAAVEEDINGDFYALMSTIVNTTVNGSIMKSLSSANYTPPLAWEVSTGYTSQECYNYGIPGLSNSETVRANSLALNANYVFCYDGKKIGAYSKTTGTLLGSIVVNTAYAEGANRTHEGIVVNECNVVYVGGTNAVHVYTFNGTTFTPGTDITTNIPGEVYDVRLDKAIGVLYVCGLGFVSVMPEPSSCVVSQLNVSANVTPGNCNGSATANVSGGTAPYTYLWSNGNTTNSINNVPAGDYYITVTDASCIRLTGIDTVSIIPSFPITVSNDTAICSGSTVQLSSSGGISYTWSPANTLNNGNIANPIATPTTTTIFHLTVSDGNCNRLDSVIITVNPMPNISLNNISLCIGQQDSLIAAGANTYIWNNGLTTSSIFVNPTSTTTYTVTGTSLGCTSTSNAVVTVNPLPNAQINPFSQATCGLNNGSATATGGTTYIWDSGQNTSAISGLAAGTYTVTVADANSCSASTSVIITATPAISTTITNVDSVICYGQSNGSVSVSISGGTPGFTYSWSTTVPQYTPTAINLPAGTYIVTATDDVGCTSTISATVYQPADILPTLAPTDAGCPYDCNGQINASVLGGILPYSYFWNNGSVSPSINSLCPGLYTVTISDNNGCQKVIDASIGVNSNINAGFLANPPDGIIPLDVAFTFTGSGASTYLWNFGDGSTSTLQDPQHTYLAAGTYNVMLIISTGSPDNCLDTAYITVTAELPSFLIVPNVFTPNGDGSNDEFSVLYQSIVSFNCIIFNRWGKKIYEWSDVSKGWDGKTEGGKQCSDGVYYYILSAKGVDNIEYDMHGTVTLLK